jgi:diaminohydroxyphosphoribosylaminopyrimidine deaminase/5-amino-6-(5-phosphoribosylamino)uracil reductase
MAEESSRLNEVYIKFATTGLPFVTLKGAASLDGKIATAGRESKWITGPAARERVHQLRDEMDAVMVGIGTILQDDPQLTTRLASGQGKDPLRVVLDIRARLPLNAKVINPASGSGTLVVTSDSSPQEKLDALRRRGVEVWGMEEQGGRIPLRPLLKRLGERQIVSLMIEGGSGINASALEEGIVDKVILFLAPRLIGGISAPSWIGGRGIGNLEESWSLKNIFLERLGDDIMIEGYLRHPERISCSPA